MERAAIIGIYDFIGYSLCRHMLDLGVEVIGIQPEGTKEDYFTEEKRLEIGRNANFTEIRLRDWDVKESEGILYVSLFESLLTRNNTDALLEALISKLEDSDLKSLPAVIILPAYFAQENVGMRGAEAKMIALISSQDSNLLTFYLPTIYGPWQPQECFFHQVMSQYSNGERKVPDLRTWEWTHDCLYIDEAVKMIKQMAESGNQGQYILSSGEQDRWLQCAGELLGKDIALLRNEAAAPVIRESIKSKTVKGYVQISNGLSRQKEQFNRIQDSRV